MRLPSLRFGFSKTRMTSDRPAGLRALEPLKMTSIMASPRRLLADCSPSTHLQPSTTLDLPQPLGPTMPVMGESKTNSVRSAKDLNPCRMSFFRRINQVLRDPVNDERNMMSETGPQRLAVCHISCLQRTPVTEALT